MSRIAHFHSLSSAETIKQIAESKKGRPSRNIYMLHMAQKFYATDSQTIKKKIFSATLACGALVPAWHLNWAFAHPSLRHWLLKARFHYSDFLETNSRRLELVGFQIPLQRLSRDKLSRACGGFVSSLSATSRASRRQTRDVSSLTQVCREFDSRK
jgi:hypothetical protein